MASSSGWWGVVWRAMVTGAVAGAVTMLVSVIVPPFGGWSQEVALCRGASGTIRDVNAVGQTIQRPTNQTLTGASVTPLTCTFPDGEVRSFDDDQVTRNGFAFAFVVGFVPVAAVSLIWRSVRQTRGGSSTQSSGVVGAGVVGFTSDHGDPVSSDAGRRAPGA